MEKEVIAAGARTLAEAAEQAQAWIRQNEKKVNSMSRGAEKVLCDLRRETRLLRRLERAATRRMCAGVFGPSQAGKSYLLSSLAANENKQVPCLFGTREHDFLSELNPAGGKESTGLVTRFTMTAPLGVTDEYPVHVRLLSETELIKIFTNSYFGDSDNKEGVSEQASEAIRQSLDNLRKRAGAGKSHITLDDMEDLREYVSNSFGGMARASTLESIYWADAIELAPKLALDDRAKLFSLIWDNIPEFTNMFLSLATDLEKLGNPEEAFFSMDALIPREASIIDVDTLGKSDFSQLSGGGKASPIIKVRTSGNITGEISRKNATAIVAELTLVMKNKPANYFEHTDLLDFPGYKARLECASIADYLQGNKADSSVEQFFRRGKVAYLFQRYNAERELTSLLLCMAAPDNTPGLPAAVEDWIISTHGKNPQDRINTKNALLYILTKSDRHFEEKGGGNLKILWDNTLSGVFVNHFSGSYSQKTKWVEEWNPGSPFNNLFMLRNINIKWDAMMNYEKDGGVAKETGINSDKAEYAGQMRENFLDSRLVKKHFRSPELAFDELMSLNDGGIGLIKRSLEPLCEPNLKLGQIVAAIAVCRDNLLNIVQPFFTSGNQDEEIKKKNAFFNNFMKLFSNLVIKERFPELLNRFKIAPSHLFYLHGEAERQFEDYKSTLYRAPIEEEAEQPVMSDEVDDLDSILGMSSASDEDGEKNGEAATAKMDESHFYAQRIIDAWSSNMRNLADTPEFESYYMFPKKIFIGIMDEFEQAVKRLNLVSRLESKFREIDAPVDVGKDKKVRKQATFAAGVLNDFISWLGKNPAATGEAERAVAFRGQNCVVFQPKPEVTDIPDLPEKETPFATQWYRDWLIAFYGMAIENVAFEGGRNFNVEENQKLGKIIRQVREARTS